MTSYTRLLTAFILAFAIAVGIAPFVIRAARRLKAGQVILSYVDNHKSKSGTPTMGGCIFLAATIAACAICFRGSKLIAYFSLAVTLAYAVNGFLDDFIKVKFKRNKGLSAIQKIIFQLSIALMVAFFVYYNPNVGSKIILVPTARAVDLGIFIIPFTVLVFLAATNSVNLTDGLDGLAGGVSLVFGIAFCAVLAVTSGILSAGNEQLLEELGNMQVLSAALCGGLLGFLVFNSHPARIFMGDTGSLALGGALACLVCLTGLPLLMPILGAMFVLSSLSVIIQVAYFKRTGKRVFLMSPYHHHLERKGLHETKIAALYMIITTILGALTLLAFCAFFKP